jgi:hypothetical protein
MAIGVVFATNTTVQKTSFNANKELNHGTTVINLQKLAKFCNNIQLSAMMFN